MDKMEILIHYGYKPDYKDLYFGAQYKAEIPNISRFNIKLDQKLLDKCWDYDFYPKYNFKLVSNEMLQLQQMCDSRAKVKIRNYIKKHDLKPDRKCMENACKYKNNKEVLDVLVSKGGKYTIKCIENCASQFKANNTLMTIIREFKKHHEENIKRIEKMEELEEKVRVLEDRLQKVSQQNEKNAKKALDAEAEIEAKSESKSKKASPKKQKTKKKLTEEEVLNNLKSELMDDLDESDEELITVTKSKKKKGGKKKKGTKSKTEEILDFDDDELEELMGKEEDTGPNIVDFSKYDLQKPTSLRKKEELPKAYRLYFKKKKTDKMSFISLKKELVGKITKNKWYSDDDQKLIDLPKQLKKRLKLDENAYVNFSDMDNLICLFYSIK